MKSRSVIKWASAGVCLILFCLLAAFYERCEGLDIGAQTAVAALVSPFMTVIMKGFSALASPVALALIGTALFFALKSREYRIPLMCNILVAVLINLGLKSNYTRARPDAALALAVETGYSFPSGHAMASMAFYGFLIFLCSKLISSKRLRRAMYAVLSFIILMVGISRIYLGVHYLTDVVAGYCVSYAYLIVFTAMIGRYISQGRDERTPEAPNKKNGSLIQSFAHAFDGVCSGLRNERNMVIHFVAMLLVIVFGLILGISRVEWMLCFLSIGAVFAAELFNTAIEAAVDLSTDKPDPRAKLAKDAAAGAVLVTAIAAAAVGAAIFLPKLYAAIVAGLT